VKPASGLPRRWTSMCKKRLPPGGRGRPRRCGRRHAVVCADSRFPRTLRAVPGARRVCTRRAGGAMLIVDVRVVTRAKDLRPRATGAGGPR
jgi:hypothetical protein